MLFNRTLNICLSLKCQQLPGTRLMAKATFSVLAAQEFEYRFAFDLTANYAGYSGDRTHYGHQNGKN